MGSGASSLLLAGGTGRGAELRGDAASGAGTIGTDTRDQSPSERNPGAASAPAWGGAAPQPQGLPARLRLLPAPPLKED